MQTRIGASAEERSVPQVVVVDVEAATDLRAASNSDDLSDTVDYGTLTVAIAKLVRDYEARLLERLAGAIAKLVLDVAGVERVRVQVAKEAPPLEEDLDVVAVRIERSSR